MGFIFTFVASLFLGLGAAAFTLCAAIPWRRRFALSSAVWFVVWIPCLMGWLAIAGLAAISTAMHMDRAHWSQLHLPAPETFFSGAFGLTMLGGTILAAFVAARLHQSLIARMNPVLFRIYATVFSVGIGGVWGWSLLLWLGLETGFSHILLLWLPSLAILCAGFGCFGYRFASELRGSASEQPAWTIGTELEGIEA